MPVSTPTIISPSTFLHIFSHHNHCCGGDVCDDQEDPGPKFQGEDSSFRLSAMKGDHLIQLEEPSTIFFVPTCGSLGFTISDFVGRILPFFFPRPLSPTRWCSSSPPPPSSSAPPYPPPTYTTSPTSASTLYPASTSASTFHT